MRSLFGGETYLPWIAIAAHTPPTTTPSSSVISVNDLLFALQLDNVNMFELDAFMEQSEIGKKLNGFAEWLARKQELVLFSSGGTCSCEWTVGFTCVSLLRPPRS